MTRASPARLGGVILCLCLAACANAPPVEVVTPAPADEVPVPVAAEDPAVKELRELRLRVDKLTTQLADAHRRHGMLNDELRRSEGALHETQKKVDELQQKLDALRTIDRDTRRQPRR
jgi:septal ring factor EnvC (AmiA/AmiB activator)